MESIEVTNKDALVVLNATPLTECNKCFEEWKENWNKCINRLMHKISTFVLFTQSLYFSPIVACEFLVRPRSKVFFFFLVCHFDDTNEMTNLINLYLAIANKKTSKLNLFLKKEI